MWLERIKAKGNYYLYLRSYAVREYSVNRMIVYKFGREESALPRMYNWRKNFAEYFPKELKELGCTFEDLDGWIKSLETKVHTKTGRKFVV